MDLFLNDPVQLRTKRRSFRLEIENPSGSGKSLAYHQEDVQVTADNTIIATTQAGSIRVPFEDLAITTYEIADPVLGVPVTFSGAAIALWLEQDYIARASALLNITPTV